MSLPFPKKKINFNTLIDNDQEGFWWNKAWRQGKKVFARTSKPPQFRGLLFEALEPRVLMSADLSYGDVAVDLTLHFDQQANEYQLLSVDANGQNGIVSAIKADATGMTDGILSIDGNDMGNTLRLDDSLQAVNIEFLGTNTNDTLVQAATVDTTWDLTGLDAGTVNTDISFTGLENLMGGSGSDVFNFADGSAITGTLDGGRAQ